MKERRTANIPKGYLELFVLKLLSQYPANGVELINLIRKATNDKWSPSPGSLYPILRKLESEGFIYRVDESNRFVTTGKGLERMKRLREEAMLVQEIINVVMKEL
ncbi:MAG: PadR family transcriptional regulator [Nitrososphaeria archaeon]